MLNEIIYIYQFQATCFCQNSINWSLQTFMTGFRWSLVIQLTCGSKMGLLLKLVVLNVEWSLLTGGCYSEVVVNAGIFFIQLNLVQVLGKHMGKFSCRFGCSHFDVIFALLLECFDLKMCSLLNKTSEQGCMKFILQNIMCLIYCNFTRLIFGDMQSFSRFSLLC